MYFTILSFIFCVYTSLHLLVHSEDVDVVVVGKYINKHICFIKHLFVSTRGVRHVDKYVNKHLYMLTTMSTTLLNVYVWDIKLKGGGGFV